MAVKKITRIPEYDQLDAEDIQRLVREDEKRKKAARMKDLKRRRAQWTVRAIIGRCSSYTQELRGLLECSNEAIDIRAARGHAMLLLHEASDLLKACDGVEVPALPVVPVARKKAS